MNLIKHFEELSFSEWPSLETLFFDNWIIRMSNGYTKRANSVNVIYGNGEIEINKKVNICEDLFQQAKIRPTYKLTILDKNKYLDGILENRGYEIIEPSNVMRYELKNIKNSSNLNFEFYNNLDVKWLNEYANLKKLNNQDKINFRIITEKISGKVFHVILRDTNNEVISLGSAAVQRNYLGILNIHTNEKYRGKGYGKQTMNTILFEGLKFGAKTSYLQVVKNNENAIKLYSGLGYTNIYEYWYRVKPMIL